MAVKATPSPKNKLLAIAREYVAARDARRKLQKEVDALEEREAACKKLLMDSMVAASVTTIGDTTLDYTLKEQDEPSVEDWHSLWKHVQQTGDFDLLYRRVNPTAVKERWDQEQKVPGVVAFPVQTLSVTKAKGAK